MNDAAIRTLMSQAIALQQQGRIGDAETLYRRILQQNPRHAAAAHFLGLAAHQQGRDDEAETLMQRAVDTEPHNPVFLGNFAQLLIECGKPALAVPIYQRWLELDAANAAAWYQLGLALDRMQALEAAAECWKRALAVKPGFTPALIALADNLRKSRFREEAEAAYREALRQSPRDIELYCKLAALLEEMERPDDALEILRRASELDQNHPGVHYQRGVILAECGDLDAAETALRHAVSLAPDFYQAYVHLVAVRKLTLDDPVYLRLEQAARLPRERENPSQSVNIEFSLGHILQDNGEYDRAFAHFSSGNTARRKLLPYSHETQAAKLHAIQQLFDAAYIERMSGSGSDADIPIFIIGMPRSGTTLLEQCLARHPEIIAGGEMVLLHAALHRRLDARYRTDLAGGLRDLDAADYSKLAQQLQAALRSRVGTARHLTDKMPSNFAIAGLLHVLFPRACLIHCRRNALDTCVSCYTALFSGGHEFSNNLRDLGLYYRLYREMMAHWRYLLPKDRFFELDYESLVRNPEPEVRRLLGFLNLPWHPDCLLFGQTTRLVQTASVIQVRRPLYSSSIGRWRKYESHLGILRMALGDASDIADTI